jgi:anthranilate synthase component 2
MKILLIDAYDSFVHTIYQYLLALNVEVDVVRNDKFTLEEIRQRHYNAIVLGPGPGHPRESNYLQIIDAFKGEIPLLGVCLGHQAITLAFGGEVVKAQHLMHGKTSLVTHTGQGCFANLPLPFTATRYHSLIADKNSFPSNELEITAKSVDDGYIMGLKHRTFMIEGVQFHPESVTTQAGYKIFETFLEGIK